MNYVNKLLSTDSFVDTPVWVSGEVTTTNRIITLFFSLSPLSVLFCDVREKFQPKVRIPYSTERFNTIIVISVIVSRTYILVGYLLRREGKGCRYKWNLWSCLSMYALTEFWHYNQRVGRSRLLLLPFSPRRTVEATLGIRSRIIVTSELLPEIIRTGRRGETFYPDYHLCQNLTPITSNVSILTYLTYFYYISN